MATCQDLVDAVERVRLAVLDLDGTTDAGLVELRIAVQGLREEVDEQLSQFNGSFSTFSDRVDTALTAGFNAVSGSCQLIEVAINNGNLTLASVLGTWAIEQGVALAGIAAAVGGGFATVDATLVGGFGTLDIAVGSVTTAITAGLEPFTAPIVGSFVRKSDDVIEELDRIADALEAGGGGGLVFFSVELVGSDVNATYDFLPVVGGTDRRPAASIEVQTPSNFVVPVWEINGERVPGKPIKFPHRSAVLAFPPGVVGLNGYARTEAVSMEINRIEIEPVS